MTAPTVRDALNTVAVLQAFTTLAKERDKEVRDFIRTELERVQEMTGTAPSLPVKGIGRAVLTEPGYRLVVDDAVAVAEWMKATERGEPVVRTFIDSAAMQADLDAGDEKLSAFLAEHGYLRDELFIPEAVREDMLAMERDEDGTVVDVATGTKLPARAVAKSAPTVQVRVEAQARERAMEMIRQRMPELTSGADA